jgi:transposase-like protein
MYLMAQTRCGISAKQLERELGVTYKTAWRMFDQIRKLLDESTSASLRGVVEIDEAAVGGKQRRGLKGEAKREGNKSTVVGMVERGGKIAALVTKDRTANTILPLVHEHVLPKSMIYTDDWFGYSRLSGNPRGYVHKRINHSQKVYVVGDVHTNTVEGFWFLLKSGILGTHHSVSAKHLQGYVDEYAFRYNHRDDVTPMYETVSSRIRRVRHGRYGAYAPLG